MTRRCAERVRMLRNYGSKTKYYNELKGFISRLDPLQAAFLRVNCHTLDAWNQRRTHLAAAYLAPVRPALTLPYVPATMEPVWHLFVIRTAQRDALQAHLNAQGIGTSIHYPLPPHLQQAYQADGDLARVRYLSAKPSIGRCSACRLGHTCRRDEQTAVIASVLRFLHQASLAGIETKEQWRRLR